MWWLRLDGTVCMHDLGSASTFRETRTNRVLCRSEAAHVPSDQRPWRARHVLLLLCTSGQLRICWCSKSDTQDEATYVTSCCCYRPSRVYGLRAPVWHHAPSHFRYLRT